MGQIIGGHMAAQVVDRHQRLAAAQRQAFGKVYAHQQSANQPRRIGHGDGVNGGKEGYSLLPKRGAPTPGNRLTVAAGGDLRHHPAIQFMFFHLGSNNVALSTRRPSSTTAAAFSSQELSIPRISIMKILSVLVCRRPPQCVSAGIFTKRRIRFIIPLIFTAEKCYNRGDYREIAAVRLYRRGGYA